MNLLELFYEIGADLKVELIKQLSTKQFKTASGRITDKVATGKLIRSIDYRIVVNETKLLVRDLEIKILAENYLSDVDEGRRPGEKMINPSQLDKWIIARGIAPRDKKGKLLPRKNLQFVIAKGIQKRGIPATNVIQKSIDAVFKRRKNDLQEAAVESFNEFVKKIFK
jgi:hypothetical protein